MQVGYGYRHKPPSGPFDAIVIGSGIGGLACAAVLSRVGGRRVLVLEQHARAGGFTHAFTRPGYDWDVGVHYVGQVGEGEALRGLFDRLSDGRIRWARMPEVYDRIEIAGRGYDLVAGKARFVARMSDYFPREADAIVRYVDLIGSTAKRSSMFFLARGLPSWMSALASRLGARGFDALARRTTLDVLRELTRDDELIAVLTGQWGDYGLPPGRSSFAMHAMLARHYLRGAYYPVGGAGSIAAGIAPLIEERGGHIAVRAEVAEVLVERGRAVGVRMADGSTLRAPLVISDAGVSNTFNRLLPAAHRPAAWGRALARAKPSGSYLALYLGMRATDAELGLTGTNLWIYPGADHDANAARYEADAEAPFPVVFVSFPSAKDPDFARRHPGRATVDVITMARWEGFERWEGTRWKRRGADYDALKQGLTDRLLEVVVGRLPQLRGRIDVAELSTPLTVAHFAGHPRGETYGLDHGPDRFALPLRARTPVPGLLITGADLATCGIAGAAMGGMITASAVLGPGKVMRLLGR